MGDCKVEAAKKLKKLNVSLPLEDSEKCVSGAREMTLLIRPDWSSEGLNHQFFTEGVTNKILSVWHDSTGTNDRILFRVFGEKTELVIDRDEELRHWKLLIEHGCAPKIYCEFINGLVYEFVAGDCLTKESVRDKTVFTAIGKCMVKQHMIPNTENAGACLFIKAREFIKNRPASMKNAAQQKRFESEFPSKETVLNELEIIEKTVLPLQSPVVFCHNDLLLQNIVFNTEKGVASFIDYEYSGFNFQAFDIGDHFSEFAGVGTDMDYVKYYPDKAFQLDWLRTYLEFWHDSNKLAPPTDKDVEKLYVQVNKFLPVTHFFWSNWAVVQAAHSTIDFDFLDYGIQRWREYRRTTTLFSSLEMPE